jgi:hypothetical protein
MSAPAPTRRVLTVSLVGADHEAAVLELRFPIPDGHTPTLPSVVAALLCAENPPTITIGVSERVLAERARIGGAP